MGNNNINTGNRNIGYWNTGNRNTGYRNTGDWNTGSSNTGYSNTGYWNTGSSNTGYWNTGYWNTGNRNTGNRNTGSSNTGNWNTGSSNTGNWNTGNWNTGYFNTNEPETVRLFNKEIEIDRDDLEFPDYFYYVYPIEWIYESDMTDEEKKDNPTYKTTGGYLKSIDYKEAWRIAWDKATDEDRKATLEVPGFDNEIFFEITGIDVEKGLNKCRCKHGNCKYHFCHNCGCKLD